MNKIDKKWKSSSQGEFTCFVDVGLDLDGEGSGALIGRENSITGETASVKPRQEMVTTGNNKRRLGSGQGKFVLVSVGSRKSNWRVSLEWGLKSWQERL